MKFVGAIELGDRIMSKMPLKNPSFNVISDVRNICDEYFDALNLNLHYFGHTSVFQDGRFNFLVSKPDWVIHTIEENIPPGGLSIYNEIHNSIKLPSLDTETREGWEALKQADDRFGIKNPLIIFRKYDDHFQCFTFDLHNENANEKYINNFELFENFIFYYKDKAMDIINMSTKNQLIFSDEYKSFNKNDQENLYRSHEFIQSQQESQRNNVLLPKCYVIMHSGENHIISVREYQCLELISHGKKTKHIANIFNISPRTVDNHIQNLKRKLNIHSNTKAIEIYWSNRIRC